MFIFFQLLILNIMKILFQALSSKLLVPAITLATVLKKLSGIWGNYTH